MGHFKTLSRLALVLLAGAASYLLAVRWGPASEADDAVVETTERSERAAVPPDAPTLVAAPAPAGASLSLPQRERILPKAEGEAFAVLSWEPPPPPVRAPPPPPPPPPPPAPVAPPLPFTFVGMMEKGGPRPQAFIARGDALLIVGVGDTISNNSYRIDSIDAQKLVMTYLPLNTAQTLNIQGANK